MFVCNRFLIVAVTAGVAWGSSSAAMAVVTTFSQVGINSFTSVTTPPDDDLRDVTGGAVELSAAGTANLNFSGTNGLVGKVVTDNVFARASLATAELKARAMLEHGTDRFGSSAQGDDNTSAGAEANFGDSFSTFEDNRPFLWTSGDTATFQFSVTGETTIPAGLENPSDLPFPTGPAGTSWNSILAQLTLDIFRPGTLDLFDQVENFDFDNRPFSEVQELFQQISDNIIARENWFFDHAPNTFNVPLEDILILDPNNPTPIMFEFTPGGDFEWMLGLNTRIFLDASEENVAVSLDLSNTVVATYTGPAGTTTASASGLFPGTVALPTVNDAVPEPVTATLGLMGLSALVVTSRRRHMA